MPHQPNVRPPAMGAFLLSRCFAPPARRLVATLLSLCSQPYEERLDHDAPVSACVHAKVPALAKKLIFARFGYRVCGCITARMAFEGSMATMNVVHSRHRQFQRLNVDGKGRHIAQLLTFLPERTVGLRRMPKWLDLPVFYSNRLPFYAFMLPMSWPAPPPVPKATDCRTSWAQGFISNV